MSDLIKAAPELSCAVCACVTVVGIVFGLQLLITGNPTEREFSPMTNGQLRLLARSGLILLLMICAVWSLLISLSAGVIGK